MSKIINAMEVNPVSHMDNEIFDSKKQYFIDRNSIFMDGFGESYGNVYDCEGKFIDKCPLKFFKTLRMNYEMKIYH